MALIYNELGEKVDYSFDTFSDRIDSILNLMHIKKIRFYADLSISRTTSINWKKGTIPLGETFMKIAKYLDVDPNWLLEGRIKDSQEETSAKEQAYAIYYTLKFKNIHNQKHKDYYMILKNTISPILLVKWYYGIQIPKLYQLKDISVALDIPFLDLLEGKVSSNTEIETNTTHKGALRYYDYLSNERQSLVDTIIMDGYYHQLYDREHQQNPDEYLTSKDPYDDPNSGFDIQDN